MSEDVKVLPSNTIDSTFETLMQDDDKEVIDLADEKPVKTEKVEKPITETTDEEEEIKIEEKSDEETDTDELIVPPKVSQITEKFPEFFKTFPFMKQMMFRDREFSELGLSSAADAKELIEKTENFSKFENDLFSGDIKSTLKAIKSTDDSSFSQIVDNLLPTLYEVDPQACAHLLNNIHRQSVKDMLEEAQQSSNEDLKTAATIFHQFVFGNTKWQEPVKFAKVDATKPAENEKQNFIKERFESAREDLTDRFNNALKSTIEQNIDPKGQMSAYVKKNAINDALRGINSVVTNDKAFKAVLDKKWKYAAENNFNKESMASIKTALLSRAKADLRDVILRSRKEAMQGQPVRTNSTKKVETEEEMPERNPNANNQGSKNAVPKGMSTKDFFLQDS